MSIGEICQARCATARGNLRGNGVRRLVLLTFSVVELLLLLAFVARPAYAYVDPGSGLLAMQVGGSMLAGALLMLRTKIRKLVGRGLASRTKDDSATLDAGIQQ